MNKEFIYCPKSGDRVFAEKAHPEMLIARYNNRSRHVFGGSPVLSWSTTCEGEYWRGHACKVLSDIIDAVGGIAWDVQGTVHCIAPRNAAFNVLRWMEAAKNALDLEGSSHSGRGQTPQQTNEYKLYLAGLARPAFASDNMWAHLSPIRFEGVYGGESPVLHWSAGEVEAKKCQIGQREKWCWSGEGNSPERATRRVVFVWDEQSEEQCELIANVWLHEGHEAPTPDSKWSRLQVSSPQWDVYSILAATPETFPSEKEPKEPRTEIDDLLCYMAQTREHR